MIFRQKYLLALLSTLFLCNRVLSSDIRPNIILVMVDDFGHECVESYGGESYTTPQLSRMANEGAQFNHAHSQNICTPSRVQILTGRYNRANYEYFRYLNPKAFSFGNLAKKAGYATCIAGKWQLNGLTYKLDGYQDSNRPHAAGFDEYCLWQLTQPRSKGERYAQPLIEQNGKLLDSEKHTYGPDVFTNYILDFIERHQKEPFLVYYPMVLTHDPFVPTPDSPEWKDTPNKKDKRFFAHMVNYMDKLVGRIHQKLEALDLSDDTILIFTADNGTHRSIKSSTQSGVVIGGKGTTPNAGTHVPMIAYWKGKTPIGNVSSDLIDFSDMLPTFGEAMKAEHPNPGVVEGTSFLPQLKGERGRPRDWVYCYYDPLWGNLGQYKNQFVRDQRYKLYQDGRLIDVSQDELEKSPLDQEQVEGQFQQAHQRLARALNQMPRFAPKPPNKKP